MESIANLAEVFSLATGMKRAIEGRQHELHGNGAWTCAIYDFLKELAMQKMWNMYPTDVPYKGEYLCDFILVDPHYGARIVCESQWSYPLNDKKRSRDWAF